MIREATESDCVNLTALTLEVWFQTYSFDGIRTENSKFALSSFIEKHFKEILHDNKYKLLILGKTHEICTRLSDNFMKNGL